MRIISMVICIPMLYLSHLARVIAVLTSISRLKHKLNVCRVDYRYVSTRLKCFFANDLCETLNFKYLLNTSYLTDSYIIFTLKIESVSKITIFSLKMMVKSGLEKIFLKFLHAGDYFPLLHKSVQNHKFINENNHLPP